MIASRQNLRGPEERDDLEQEARVGVIRGCERFDPQRAVRPSTFLEVAANGQVLHFRRDRASTIRFLAAARHLRQRTGSCSNNNSRPASHPCRMLSWPTLSTSRFSAAGGLPQQQAERLVPISSIHEPASSSGDFVPEERWLQRALQLLKPQQRRLLQRHFIEGDSVRRIAAHRCPSASIARSIRAALELLQRWAEQDGLLPIRSCRPSTALP